MCRLLDSDGIEHDVARKPMLTFRHHAPALRPALVLLAMAAMGMAAQAQSGVPAGYGSRPYTPKDFRLPEGSGCAGDIARWKAIQSNDYASGNVSLKVYNQIQNEIDHASAVCQEGRDAQARKLVAASRARHGYPQ